MSRFLSPPMLFVVPNSVRCAGGADGAGGASVHLTALRVQPALPRACRSAMNRFNRVVLSEHLADAAARAGPPGLHVGWLLCVYSCRSLLDPALSCLTRITVLACCRTCASATPAWALSASGAAQGSRCCSAWRQEAPGFQPLRPTRDDIDYSTFEVYVRRASVFIGVSPWHPTASGR